MAPLVRRTSAMVRTKCSAPPSARSSRVTQVMTTWASPKRAAASPTRRGSSASTGRGCPLRTLQKRQARVHTSPKIITVAVFWA